jgi:hypothetical protein
MSQGIEGCANVRRLGHILPGGGRSNYGLSSSRELLFRWQFNILSTSSKMLSSNGYAAFVVAFAILTVGFQRQIEIDSADAILAGFYDLYCS